MAVDRRRIYHKRDRLRQLRAFCCVAAMKSITRAAEFLDLTQAAVSFQVRELEYEVEAVLLDRSRRGISLTPAGERLYELARPLVEGMDAVSGEFVAHLVDSNSHRVRMGATQTLTGSVVPTYLRRFQELHPDVRVHVLTCRLSEGVEGLLADDLDFVLGSDEHSLQVREDLQYHHVGSYDIALITALDHPLAGRERVSPKELSGYPAIGPSPGLYSRHIERIIAHRFDLEKAVGIEAGRWSVIKRYVELGLGISIVPGLCVSENDALWAIDLKEHFPTLSYGVITRRGKSHAPGVQSLVRTLAPDYLS